MCILIKKKKPFNGYFEIKEELKKKIKMKSKAYKHLNLEEQNLLNKINEITSKLNRNNVTRTNAYYDFFLQHREIHWAFLAHMVSRNGGWYMTDLKGDLVSRFLSEKEQEHFFLFLERSNWLIFHDAYPQLLIYEESLIRNRKLFYLLPHFGVSKFMVTMWEYFWEQKDYHLLTIGTIVNEQQYIEKRVIQNSQFKKSVLYTLEFKLYDFLRLNQIIFPFIKNEKTYLMGKTMQHFDSLSERIKMGKQLYTLLFHDKTNFKSVLSWANNHSHTASRKDYWSHLFHDVNESLPGSIYKSRTKNCMLKKGTNRIYSPKLEYAWKNIDQPAAEEGDWCNDWRIIDYLNEEKNPSGEIIEEYCKSIEKIELAIIAKKAFFLRR